SAHDPSEGNCGARMIRGFALPLQAEPCLRERAPPRRAKRVAAGCEPIDVSSCLTGGTPMKLRLFSLALLACGPAAAQAPSGPPLVDDTMLAYVATKDSVELPDGRMLHFVCLGSGSPTVIMTAGLGGDGSDFR